MSVLIRKYNTALKKDLLGLINQDDISFPIPEVKELPKIIFVSPFFQNSDNYRKTSITEALQAANDNETIVILPAIYEETIIIQNPARLHFMGGAVLSSTNNVDLITIDADCLITGNADINHQGSDVANCALRISSNANCLIEFNQLVSENCKVQIANNANVTIKANEIKAFCELGGDSITHLNCKLIYDVALSSNAIIKANIYTFRKFYLANSSKAFVKFYDTINPPTSIAPNAKNIEITDGYGEFVSGTLRLTTNQGYPAEITGGTLRLRNVLINQKDTTLNCINIGNGVAILDNCTLVTDANNSIVGAGTLKNYNSKTNKDLANTFIWGINYLIELLTINNNVE